MTTTGRRFDYRKIAQMRRKAGITQLELSNCSGIPLDTVRQYEQGRSAPSVERLFILADTIQCSTDDFTTGGVIADDHANAS